MFDRKKLYLDFQLLRPLLSHWLTNIFGSRISLSNEILQKPQHLRQMEVQVYYKLILNLL